MAFSAENLLNNTDLSLEKTALEKFGAVVDDFERGSFDGIRPELDPSEGLGEGEEIIETPREPPRLEPRIPENTAKNQNDNSWYASSYAAALSNGSFRPKLKFLFKVEFIFTETAKRQFPALRTAKDFTFMIKSVERPKVDFEYEDDVNMYNYRTKVLKKIRHRDLTLVFMDDVGNRVFEFFRIMMMIHSPITRRQRDRDNSLRPPEPSNSPLNFTSGMSFEGNEPYAAMRSVVNSQAGNSIEAIRVKQIFVDGSESLATATKMVTFDFMNPRIISFDMDELTHESSDPNLLTMVFDYDWMEMVNVGALGRSGTEYTPDYTHVGPGITGAPTDISPNMRAGAVGTGQGDGAGFLGGGSGRRQQFSAQQLSPDDISRSAKIIAGTGGGNRIGGMFGGGLRGTVASAVASSAWDSVDIYVPANLGQEDEPMSSLIESNVISEGSPSELDDFGLENAISDSAIVSPVRASGVQFSTDPFLGFDSSADDFERA